MTRITWLGHSTVVIDDDGVRLLTDPVFRGRMGPLYRVTAPAPDVPPDLDGVLISHLHRDHLDAPSLRRIRGRSTMVVPRGGGSIVRRLGFRDVHELDEGQELRVRGVTVRATRAEHRVRRNVIGRATPALGYLVSGGRRVYFAGDTDLFPELRLLAGEVDVAVLPIAGWGPRTSAGHLDPRRAAEALALLRPRDAVPVHWGTYRRIDLPREEAVLREPVEAFLRFASELASDVHVHVLLPGESVELDHRAPVAAG